MECLTEEKAINLFKEKVGQTTLNSHPEIPQWAEIAATCTGDHWASYGGQEHSTRMGAIDTNVEDLSIKAFRYGRSCISDPKIQL